MGSKSKSTLLLLICAILFFSTPFRLCIAQDNTNVKEPPIPVYIMPTDSAASGTGQSTNQLVTTMNNKVDSLQLLIHTSSGENTVHFIWLYSLIALLGIMHIVMLYSTSRMRKEMAQIKHLEHQKLLLAAEATAVQHPAPVLQEIPKEIEPPKIKSRARVRKPRISKPRVKKEK